jgi:hypothetical protein
MQEALNFCLSIQVQKGDTRQSFALARSWIGAKPEMLAAKNNTRSRALTSHVASLYGNPTRLSLLERSGHERALAPSMSKNACQSPWPAIS